MCDIKTFEVSFSFLFFGGGGGGGGGGYYVYNGSQWELFGYHIFGCY